jgi:DNA-binding response OmpR family regulator
MPEIDGVELVQRFRHMQSTAQTPIIVATITDDKVVKGRALNAGATDFLMKPIDHDECRARCRNLLALSEYQTLLREHIVALTLNYQINPTLDGVRLPFSAYKRSHVEVGYNELFALTSTVAAIDRLLEPLRTTISELEGTVQLPLVGQKSRARAQANPNTHLFHQAAAYQKTRVNS